MRTWVVIAPSARAETVRRTLRERGVLRREIRAVRGPSEVVFPVLEAPEPAIPGTRLEEREMVAAVARPRSYRDLVELEPGARAQLPRAFDVVGDVVLIRLPDGLATEASEIGRALLGFVPGARKVGWDHGVQGTARLRQLTPLAGRGPWRTLYRENGLEWVVDPEVAYFSPRLAREHLAVADQVGAGEAVWDLCCGIGPFSLTITRRHPGVRVTAVDSNAGAIALLRENAERLGVSSRIEARTETVEQFLRGAGAIGRVILNLPHEGIKYLPSVSGAVAPGGTIHYYEVTPRTTGSMRAAEIVEQMIPAQRWTCLESHRVHPYSPQSDLRAYTFRRR